MEQYIGYYGDLFFFLLQTWLTPSTWTYISVSESNNGREKTRESFDSRRTFECVVIQLKRPTGTGTGHRVSQCQRQDLQWKSLENPVIAWGGQELCEQNLKSKRKSFWVFSSDIIFLSKCRAIYCGTADSV